MKSKNWSLATRFLHVGLVLTVSTQLFISLVMEEPGDKQSMLGGAMFEAHEIVGLTALVIVLIHWGWSVFSQADGGLANLFPWDKEGRQQVNKDIKGLVKLQLPEGGVRGGVPGLVHGLGLLAVTGIALTGGVLFLFYPEHGDPGVLIERVEEAHEILATFVWAYWMGHAGIAVLHHLLGHEYVKKMFTFSDKKTQKYAVIEEVSADARK